MHKLLTLIITILILYAVVKSKMTTESPQPTKPQLEKEAETAAVEKKGPEAEPEMGGGFLERSLSQVLVNVLKTENGKAFFEKLVRPANEISGSDISIKVNNNDDIIKSLFKINTILEGKGEAVSCGHIVTASYQITNMHGLVIDSGQKTFRLGKAEVIPALDNVIVGMKIGGVREAITHTKYAYDSPNFSKAKPKVGTSDYYKIRVTLQDAIPKLFADNNVRIFDDELAHKIPLMCGEYAVFDVKIMKLDGTVIFDSKASHKQVSMFLGDIMYPMIFSHALYNKISAGTRTVICGGKYLRSLASKERSKIFHGQQPPMDEFYIMEFSNVAQQGG